MSSKLEFWLCQFAAQKLVMTCNVVGILSHPPNPPHNKTGFICLYVKIL